MKRLLSIVAVGAATIGILAGCSSGSSGSTGSSYTPQHRTIQMVTLQALIAEFGNIPGLKDEEGAALKPGGPTGGHEVYAWDPAAITVYQGDTVTLVIHDAQKDPHIFNLEGYGISNKTILPDSERTITFKATKAGVFRYFCGVPDHMPWMQGWLTVLPDSDA